jgi:hypothetical protein
MTFNLYVNTRTSFKDTGKGPVSLPPLFSDSLLCHAVEMSESARRHEDGNKYRQVVAGMY